MQSAAWLAALCILLAGMGNSSVMVNHMVHGQPCKDATALLGRLWQAVIPGSWDRKGKVKVFFRWW